VGKVLPQTVKIQCLVLLLLGAVDAAVRESTVPSLTYQVAHIPVDLAVAHIKIQFPVTEQLVKETVEVTTVAVHLHLQQVVAEVLGQ
jgi:hypothetical protein